MNTEKQCAGSTQVVSTVATIASAYAASTSSAAAAASASSIAAASASAAASESAAAAVPSAGCYILNDDGFGDLALLVYGINGWAGPDGSALEQQESGCGIFGGWDWETDGQSMFDGAYRDVQYASFGLSFVKAGCVERAVKSAGGPEIQCQNGSPTLDQLSVPEPNEKRDGDVRFRRWLARRANRLLDVQSTVDAVTKAIVPNLQAVAAGTWPNGTVTDGTTSLNTVGRMLSVKAKDEEPSVTAGAPSAAASVAPPSPSLVDAAKEALQHLT